MNPANVALTNGTRIGPYEIVGALGQGGMGDVYRGRDERLGRDVAIKALPARAADDPDLVARFRREAQLLASLNHPHIAAIYGLEDGPPAAGGTRSQFIVLELAEGGTLADRIAGRTASGRRAAPQAIALDQALALARQVADALEAAHEKGIVHRDLKPNNIALTAAGGVKVLDFGLAKALTPDSEAATELGATQVGTVLGTIAYMSPEQTRGQRVDKRTDIWAFGCVLFEMLSGRQAFAGASASDVAAAILDREPDWRALPATTPARITWLIRRCLEKDPKQRLHDIADARIEIEGVLSRGGDTDPRVADPGRPNASRWPRGRELTAWIAAALAILALLASYVLGRRQSATDGPGADTSTINSAILLPEGLSVATDSPPGRFALSPNGRQLAVVASKDGGPNMLWVRPLDSSTALQLPGTEGAAFPFWSPDSRRIAFLAQRKLKHIEVATGRMLTLCDAEFGATGSWNQDDVILFTPKGSAPIHRISASGGTASAVTSLDATRGEVQHSFPFFLPDGQHFLYFTVGTKTGGMIEPGGISVGSLDGRTPPSRILEQGSNAKYASQQVIFMRQDTLVSQPFDPKTLRVSGELRPLVEQVQIAGSASTGTSGAYSVSETGVLAYQTGVGIRSQLVWVNRRGIKTGNLGDAADYADVVLSPDQSRLATSVLDPAVNTRDIWIYDVARGIRTRLTFEPSDDFAPTWSPDGKELIFSSHRTGGTISLFRRPSEASGQEQPVVADALGLGKFATDWSRDGKYLLYIGGSGIIARSDLWVAVLSGDKTAFPFQDTQFVESNGRFSPDGKWIAYMSREEGRPEVFVRPFGRPGPPQRISNGGGWPRWRRDGKEIVYLSLDNKLMSVPVSGDGSVFQPGTARPLFAVQLRPITRLDAYPYDMSDDGERFLLNGFVEAAPAIGITLVVNWAR